MSEPKAPYAALEDMLVRTREQELDCEQFLTLLAPYLDQKLEDPGIRKLIEHHRDLCAECAEELGFLRRGLSSGLE